jgi:hypothetical protein
MKASTVMHDHVYSHYPIQIVRKCSLVHRRSVHIEIVVIGSIRFRWAPSTARIATVLHFRNLIYLITEG